LPDGFAIHASQIPSSIKNIILDLNRGAHHENPKHAARHLDVSTSQHPNSPLRQTT
jgi:hypothetical protein